MKKRMKDIGGILEITNEKGTQVKLTVPCHYNFCSIVAKAIENYFRNTHEHFIIHS